MIVMVTKCTTSTHDEPVPTGNQLASHTRFSCSLLPLSHIGLGQQDPLFFSDFSINCAHFQWSSADVQMRTKYLELLHLPHFFLFLFLGSFQSLSLFTKLTRRVVNCCFATLLSVSMACSPTAPLTHHPIPSSLQCMYGWCSTVVHACMKGRREGRREGRKEGRK